jgi:uncharacterized alpha-E superfamily protein
MLSRVAEALYWMGRYLERAENVTRLLLVTEDLATEVHGFNEKLAHAEWSDVLAIFPGAEFDSEPTKGADSVALDHLSALFTNPYNPSSIHFSFRRARENARAAREALTVEVFVSLNEAFRALESHTRRPIRDLPGFRDVLSATHKDLLGIVGAIESTLTRDQGWSFLRLGEALERALRAATILTVKLRSLGAMAAGLPLPLYYTQWRSLLRGLSSLENYRKMCGAGMEPQAVTHFLVFDGSAPRSLRFGATAVKAYLDLISGPNELTPPGRIIGRVVSRLCYDDTRWATIEDAIPLVEHVLAEVAKTHEAIEAHYFGT